jgi:sec-independent protein translocase protein TatB
VFNIQGSEMIFLLLVALIVLGPEKLPDAVRKAGRAYAEFKKMANGFQGELKTALDDPMRELRDTAEAMRQAVNFDTPADAPEPEAAPEPPPIVREPGLNFGSANPRTKPEVPPEPAVEPTPIVREPGLNFGSANPRPKPQDPAE